ncbi:MULTISPECIES: hypothetical protein [Paraburkholderia]|uniref:hypothetical protein n=1 Tax=Paraburkholderia TaxID=1822464 RepID=UPI003B7C0A87
MKVHHNAEKLCAWMRQYGAATVKQIAASGTLNSRAASDAVQYAVRHGVLERVKQSGATPSERVQYQLTGRELPVLKSGPTAPSFDALLCAWGIPQKPPIARAGLSHRVEVADCNLEN